MLEKILSTHFYVPNFWQRLDALRLVFSISYPPDSLLSSSLSLATRSGVHWSIILAVKIYH